MQKQLEHAALESWMRRYYFAADYDIGSSGVANYSLAEVRRILGISVEELDRLVFHDSQTLGGDGVRKALADQYLDGDQEKVMVTHGSTEANFLIMSTLVEPGHEVVVLDPCYQQLYAVAAARGATLRRWHLRYENDFRPDFSELRSLLSSKTRMIVVNFPHNPTGATLTRKEQEDLLALAAEFDAYLVWDGAFSLLTYGNEPLPEPVLSYEKALSMGTLSKAYGLPGMRIGWCFAHPDLLNPFIRWRDYTLLHTSPLIEFFAERAIRHDQALITPRLNAAHANRMKLAAWIARYSSQVEWVEPGGGVCAFVRFSKIHDTEPLCHRLAQEHRVLLVPGSTFGMPQYARLGFGGTAAELAHGLEVLGMMLEEM